MADELESVLVASLREVHARLQDIATTLASTIGASTDSIGA